MKKPVTAYAVVCKNEKIHIFSHGGITTSLKGAQPQLSLAFAYYHDLCGPHRIATLTERPGMKS